MRVLVMGSGKLASRLKFQGHEVFRTQRQFYGDLFFDLRGNVENLVDDFPEVDIAVVPIGITNYWQCENPEFNSDHINVTALKQLAHAFHKRGVFSVFISSNSVFGGQKWPREDDVHTPADIAYSRQKSHAEAGPWTCVIRLTKIITYSTPPIDSWLKTWSQGGTVEAFDDFVISPISMDYAARNVEKISLMDTYGKFHLSGAQNVTYFDLACEFNSGQVKHVTSDEAGVRVLWKPKFSGLSMKETTKLFAIEPQPLESVVEDVKREIYLPVV